tara:strand:- start:476 stop:715 length:240 start_codon:yes stop_codon:yes gene_type:complete
MNGIGIITKHGHAKHMECHPNQDIVVLTTVANVVTGRFQQEQVTPFLKCGAADLQEQVVVAVCKVMRQTQEVMLLKVLI